MEYLLIDGYNVINAWDDMFNLKEDPMEDCREKLLNILSNFQGFRKVNVIVVFDAHLVKGSRQKKEAYDNLTVVFTKENETADNYIERFVYTSGNTHTVRVVTSDYLEQKMILSSGGIRVTPRELKEEIKTLSKGNSEKARNKRHETNSLFSNVSQDIMKKLEKIRRG